MITNGPKTLFLLATTSMLLACPNPADKAPKAKVGEKTAAVKTGAAKAPAAGKAGAAAGPTTAYTIGEGTKVNFVGSKVTGNHEGGFKTVSGTLNVTADIVGSKGTISIDTASVFSDAEKLTGHLQSPDFFDVAKFPKATFDITHVAKGAEGFVMGGTLDLHGVKKPIEFPAQIKVEGGMISAKSEFSINRKDFNINYPGKPDDLIRDAVLIKLDVVAKK